MLHLLPAQAMNWMYGFTIHCVPHSRGESETKQQSNPYARCNSRLCLIPARISLSRLARSLTAITTQPQHNSARKNLQLHVCTIRSLSNCRLHTYFDQVLHPDPSVRTTQTFKFQTHGSQQVNQENKRNTLSVSQRHAAAYEHPNNAWKHILIRPCLKEKAQLLRRSILACRPATPIMQTADATTKRPPL